MISSKARKQRKELYNLPNHKKQKQLVSRLSEELMVKYSYSVRRFPLKKGDTVKVVRGESKYKGKSGKVLEINLSNRKIAVENITRAKVDGKYSSVWVDSSNVIITKLDLSDRYRKEKLFGIFEKKGISQEVAEEE